MIFGINVTSAVTAEVLYQPHFWPIGIMIGSSFSGAFLIIALTGIFENTGINRLKRPLKYISVSAVMAILVFASIHQGNSIAEESNRKLSEALNSKYGLVITDKMVTFSGFDSDKDFQAIDIEGNKITVSLKLNEDMTEVDAYMESGEIKEVDVAN